MCKVPASAGAFDNCSIRIWQEKSACCGRIASPHCVYVLRSLRQVAGPASPATDGGLLQCKGQAIVTPQWNGALKEFMGNIMHR